MKYIKNEENSSRHLKKDLKVKELIYYVNVFADDATSNVLRIDIIKSTIKNNKMIKFTSSYKDRTTVAKLINH